METITIQLLDGDINGDKTYSCKDLTMVNLYRTSSRLKEYHNPAFYILIGPDENQREIYVGQSSNIGRRLYEHKLHKSFWIECLFFITNDQHFTKTDTLWLEEHAIKKFIDLNYFQTIQNYQIPQNVIINDTDQQRLEQLEKYIELLIGIYGKINITAECQSYTENADSGQKIIDRIVKSYADYTNDSLDYAYDRYEDYGIDCFGGAKYMELGNGRIMIFKNSILKGIIPKKYKDKISNNILQEDIVVENLIKAKDIIG